MAARRYDLDRLLLLEFAEADRALERALLPAPVVGDEGERRDGGGVHPMWVRGGLASSPARYVGRGLFGEAAGVDGDEAHEEEGGEEDEDGDGHRRVDGGGGASGRVGLVGRRREVGLGGERWR